jgi:peptide/nickel transport system permease protein
MLVAIPIGVISAIRPRSALDRATMGGALVAISAPVYFLGLIALFLFSNDIGVVHVLPGAGTYTPITVSPWRWFTSLLMPWCVLAAGFAAFYARMVRGNLIDTMGEDYIRTARAKGQTERKVLVRHALANAAVPIVTVIGLGVALLIGGVVVTESVYTIPGLGRLTVDAVLARDYPTIQAVILLFSLTYVLINLLVDVTYTFFDPRIRY